MCIRIIYYIICIGLCLFTILPFYSNAKYNEYFVSGQYKQDPRYIELGLGEFKTDQDGDIIYPIYYTETYRDAEEILGTKGRYEYKGNETDCKNLHYQEIAQDWYEDDLKKYGFDTDRLDGDNNGKACEELPSFKETIMQEIVAEQEKIKQERAKGHLETFIFMSTIILIISLPYIIKYFYKRSKLNKDGYDQEGYDINGFDRRGFNDMGWNKTTKTYYDKEGYDKYGYDKNGYSREGYDAQGYNEKGYDRNGYDKNGFNGDGIYTNGTKYNEKGYDINGYNKDGYNQEGYDKNGYDSRGYDQGGYDKNGKLKEGLYDDDI